MTDAGTVTVALAQVVPPSRDLQASYTQCITLLDQAARAGADWLILPELFVGGYQIADVGDLALPADDPLLVRLQGAATNSRLGLQVGFAESGNGVIYDSVLTVSPTGEAHVYRKTHLFGREPEAFTPGSDLSSLKSGPVHAAPLICYDLEFPEPARMAALSGAQLILVSTANMVPYAEAQVLFARTRALENQVYVAVANRVGRESGYQFCGNSIVTDPFGRVVAQAGAEEAFLIARCGLHLVSEARQANHYLADRRPDLYARLLEDSV